MRSREYDVLEALFNNQSLHTQCTGSDHPPLRHHVSHGNDEIRRDYLVVEITQDNLHSLSNFP